MFGYQPVSAVSTGPFSDCEPASNSDTLEPPRADSTRPDSSLSVTNAAPNSLTLRVFRSPTFGNSVTSVDKELRSLSKFPRIPGMHAPKADAPSRSLRAKLRISSPLVTSPPLSTDDMASPLLETEPDAEAEAEYFTMSVTADVTSEEPNQVNVKSEISKPEKRRVQLTAPLPSPFGPNGPSVPRAPLDFAAWEEEQARARLPPFDRDTDLTAVCGIPHVSVEYQMIELEPGFFETESANQFLFALPSKVRREIYSYLFPYESRKILLSRGFATKVVYPTGFFATRWDVLDNVWAGLKVPILRDDLLVYFWTEYKFHVTLSAFTAPVSSPLAMKWLPQFAHIIQSLTIEVDLSKFGTNNWAASAKYGLNKRKETQLLATVIESLCARRGESTLNELNILCRRITGFRPFDPLLVEEFGTDPIPYCPESAMSVFDSVGALKGIVRRLRLVGLYPDYSKSLIDRTMEHNGEVKYTESIDIVYPPLAPPAPAPKPKPAKFSRAGLTAFLKRRQEEETGEPAKPSARRSKKAEKNAKKVEKEAEAGADGTAKDYEKTENGWTTIDLSASSSSAEFFNQKDSSANLKKRRAALSSPSADLLLSFSRLASYVPATPRSQSVGDDQILTTSQPGSSPLPSRIPRPSVPGTPPRRVSNPQDLNVLNEQDPAFQRTINALRSLSVSETNSGNSASAQAEASNSSTSGSKKRANSSLSHTQRGKKNSGTFVGRLRGRGSA